MGKLGRRATWLVVLCLATALLASGCAKRADPSDPNTLFGADGVSSTQAKQDYTDGLAQVQSVLNAPDAPPLQQVVSVGQKQGLVAYALRWDQATQQAANLTPPKDVAADHRQLVTAMQQIGKYNHQIANAAPSKARVRRLAKAAQSSVAAKQFNAALAAIGRKGYLGDPSASPSGLDGQGTLDGGGTDPSAGGDSAPLSPGG